jgi:translation elongation factor EF-G
MSNAGRPTIMTPDIIAKLEEAFEWGCSDLEACGHANIGKSTLYNYQEAHPEFVERKEQLKENPVRKARQSVVQSLESDPKLAMDYLKNKKNKEFNTKQEIDQKTEVSGTFDFKSLTDEELKEMI